MNEDEFLNRWRKDVPMYRAWGDHVVDCIEAALTPRIAPISADVFLRLPPRPVRTKSEISFLEKAFYRKSYNDPYTDVTDKVGVRFVVLVASQIKIIEEALLSIEDWNHSKDKDYEKEQSDYPLQFTYAALHYVVSPIEDIMVGQLQIPSGTPCEVQIKTIMQHAYSEITHDTIYKPKFIATPDMQRAAAKSMALIEATNDYFEEVLQKVSSAVQTDLSLTSSLDALYKVAVGVYGSASKAEGLILDAYSEEITEGVTEKIATMLHEHSYIGEQIKRRQSSSIIFRQPSILLVYWLAYHKPNQAKRAWPLPSDILRTIFTDIGKSFDAAD